MNVVDRSLACLSSCLSSHFGSDDSIGKLFSISIASSRPTNALLTLIWPGSPSVKLLCAQLPSSLNSEGATSAEHLPRSDSVFSDAAVKELPKPLGDVPLVGVCPATSSILNARDPVDGDISGGHKFGFCVFSDQDQCSAGKRAASHLISIGENGLLR